MDSISEGMSDGRTTVNCIRTDGLEVQYSNYQNELKKADYTIDAESIVVGDKFVFEDVEQQKLNFTFTDFSDEEAKKFTHFLKQIFAIDLKIYEESLAGSK